MKKTKKKCDIGELVDAVQTVIWDSDNVDQDSVNDDYVVIHKSTLDLCKESIGEIKCKEHQEV